MVTLTVVPRVSVQARRGMGGSAMMQLFLNSCSCCPKGKHWADSVLSTLNKRCWTSVCQAPQEHITTISNPSTRPAERSPCLQVPASSSTGLSQRLFPTAPSVAPKLFLFTHFAALHPLNEYKGWGVREDYSLLPDAPVLLQLASDCITLRPSSQETHILKLFIH